MDTPSPSADAPRAQGPLRDADAFDILRLEATFELDPKVLAERHRSLSLALHPDRFAGRPSAERRLALEQAMQVNSAYRTLRDPVRRAELLAQRRGIELDAGLVASPEFLERTMERREALADAVLAGNLVRVEELAGEGRTEQAEVLRRLGVFFAGGHSGAPEALGALLSSLRFLQRFVEAAEAELEAHQT